MMKMGRNRPLHPHRMRFVKYAADQATPLPEPPPSVDFTPLALTSLSLIYKNDVLGCCVIAGKAHIEGVETANAGEEFIASDDQIVAMYSAVGGYVPGDDSTDNGCDEVSAFAYWKANGGIDGVKIAGAVSCDATNQRQCMQCVSLFENGMLAIELPNEWTADESAAVWDVAGDPNPNQGHCVVVVGYTTSGILVSTWGMVKLITWAAVAKYCVESAGGAFYSILSPDMVAKGQDKAPNGFDWATLADDFATLQAVA